MWKNALRRTRRIPTRCVLGSQLNRRIGAWCASGFPACQDFVRIALVSDIPHQLVFGRVVHIVQGDGQFDRARIAGEMPAGLPDRFQQKGTQLVGKARQLFLSGRRKSCGLSIRSSRGLGFMVCLFYVSSGCNGQLYIKSVRLTADFAVCHSSRRLARGWASSYRRAMWSKSSLV